MRNCLVGGLALVLAAMAVPGTAEALTANCNVAPSTALGDALAMAVPGDVIEVIGTCTQNVEIRQDDVTIQGDGNDTVVGQLFVTAARRVTIQELGIQGDGTPGLHGIAAVSNATITVRNVVIENISGTGVVVTSNATGELDHVTIRNAANQDEAGVIAYGSADVLITNSLIENNYVGVNIGRGTVGVVIDSTIQNNASRGISVDSGGSLVVLGSDTPSKMIITGNAGGGIGIIEHAIGNVSNSIVENNGDIGIDVNQGSSATVTNSTIENNGEVGIHVGYSSTANLNTNTIQATAIPVSIDFGASALLGNNAVTATSSDDAALDIDWGATVRLAGGNTLHASPNGYSIFLQQGATLVQRSELDTAIGPVWLRSVSNAEFRKIHITGNVQVEDHSLVRFRDLAGSPNVSVTGNILVSRDSGLNFIRNAGDRRITVVGNITCADTESSISAPSSNVTITGKTKDCTGYNNVSN